MSVGNNLKRLFIVLFLFVASSIAVSAATADITPTFPLSQDNLTCTLTGTPPPFGQTFLWYKDESSTPFRTVETLSTSDELDNIYTSAGDRWDCVIKDTFSGITIDSTYTIIGGTSADVIVLPTPVAYTTDNLTCIHNGTSIYYYEWLLNSNPTGINTQTIDFSQTTKGQTWRCEVREAFGNLLAGAGERTVSNSPPVTSNLNISTPEDTMVSFTLTASDDDLDPISFTNFNANNGTVSVSSLTGEVNYTPDLNFFGIDNVTFTAFDGEDNSSLALITINVSAVNDAPVVADIPNATFLEDGMNNSIDLDAYVTDAENDPITWTYEGSANVFVDINATDGIVTFTAAPNWFGVETIGFIASDGILNDSDDVVVTVISVNDFPEWNWTANTTINEDEVPPDNWVDLWAYASDVENLTSELVFNMVSQSNDVLINCSILGNRYFNCSAPAAEQSGFSEINLSAFDGTDYSYNVFNVTVLSVNDVPVLAGIPDVNVNEDTYPPNNWVDLWAYASDVENLTSELTYAIVSESNASLIDCWVDVNQYVNCSLPAADQNGISVINVSVFDGQDYAYDDFIVTVNPVNDAPVFDHILQNQAVDEGFLLTYDINASDVDGDLLSFTTNISSLGAVIDNTGFFSWTPTNNEIGTHTVEVTVCDNSGALNNCTTGTFDITVNDIPFAAYTAGPYTGYEGSAVNFSGFAAGGSVPYAYRWDFDNDGAWDTPWSTIADSQNTWNDDYSGIVMLQANDTTNAQVNTTTIVTINNVAPTANAGGPYSCVMGDVINLTGSATDPAGVNDNITYAWDLNDDSIFETPGQIVNFSCLMYGYYTVNLSASDEDGGIGYNAVQVFVDSPFLVADANGPYSGNEGSPIVFNATVFGGLAPYEYRWDFNNDGAFDTPWTSASTASYTIDDDYDGTIMLEVRDSTAKSANDAANLTVNNVAPTADADGPYGCILGENITLYGTATDPGNDNLTYEWDLNNDSIYEISGQNAVFQCNANGSYPVNLMVTDDDGASDIAGSVVAVNLPTLLVSADGPYSGAEGFAINFNGFASGGLGPYQYRWDFDNDGTFDTAWNSTLATAYAYPDDYSGNAVLEVMDSAGNSVTDTASVTVSNLAPAAHANGPYMCREGENLTLNGYAEDYGVNDVIVYSWDLNNDGGYETYGQNPVYPCWAIGSHVISMRATDDDGGVDTDTTTVNVNIMPDLLAPTVVIHNPISTVYTSPAQFGNLTLNISASDAKNISTIWYTINGVNPTYYLGPINYAFADNSAYTITAYANDTSGNIGYASVLFHTNTSYSLVQAVEVEEPKIVYEAKVDKIRMTNDGFLVPGDDLRTTITISNIGDDDLDDLRITVVVPELGIWRHISNVDLDKGDRTTREVVIDMPNDVEPGEYTARMVISNGKTRRVVHRPIVIE